MRPSVVTAVALLTRIVSDCLRCNGRLDEALAHARMAAQTFVSWAGADDPQASFYLRSEGDCLLALGRRQEALDILKRAADLARRDPAQQHPAIVAVYESLARATQA